MACIVHSCCCGCTLRTGSLIIAVLNIIGCCLNIASNAALGISGSGVAWGAVAVNAIALLINIMLAVGIQKNKANLVMAWVWANAIVMFVNIVLGIVLIAMGGGLVAGIVLAIVFAFNIYFIVVVRSFAIVELGGSGNIA